MRISDWSSDVCSSDLRAGEVTEGRTTGAAADIEDVAREPGRHVADLPFHDRGAAPAADLPADRAECCEEPEEQCASDRKSVVQGKSVSVSVDLGGRRITKNTSQPQPPNHNPQTQPNTPTT